MVRVTALSSPFLLGFDGIERALDKASKSAADGYPPYNIERIAAKDGAPEILRITLAVAGFSQDQIEVTQEENQLTIRGRQQDDKTREYLHRGIAARQFQRSFLLADGMQVRGAELANGLLSIDVARPHDALQLRDVGLRDGIARVKQTFRERAVVGGQQHAARVEIEAADRVHAPRQIAQEVTNARPALGIAHRRDDAARLVKEHVNRRLGGYPLTVHLDAADPRVDLRPEFRHHATIDANAARRDEPLGGAPRSDPCIGERLLQPDHGHRRRDSVIAVWEVRIRNSAS